MPHTGDKLETEGDVCKCMDCSRARKERRNREQGITQRTAREVAIEIAIDALNDALKHLTADPPNIEMADERIRDVLDQLTGWHGNPNLHLGTPAAEVGTATEDAVSNPRDVPEAHKIINRLCALQARVCSEVLGYDQPADCFCGDGGFWPLRNPDDYRNAGLAIEFIEAATLRAIQQEAETERLQEALDVLQEVQWSGYSYIGVNPCPMCAREEPRHAPDCRLAAVLATQPAERQS